MKNILSNLEKLKNRKNILEEIKDKVIPIRDTTKTTDENNNNIDYTGVADDVLNEDWYRKTVAILLRFFIFFRISIFVKIDESIFINTINDSILELFYTKKVMRKKFGCNLSKKVMRKNVFVILHNYTPILDLTMLNSPDRM